MIGRPASAWSTFGRDGLHSRALAGRENHDVESHAVILPLAARAPAPRLARRGYRRLGQRPEGVVVVQDVEVVVVRGLGGGLRADRDGPCRAGRGHRASRRVARGSRRAGRARGRVWGRRRERSCASSSAAASSSLLSAAVAAVSRSSMVLGAGGPPVELPLAERQIDRGAVEQRPLAGKAHDDGLEGRGPRRCRRAAAGPPCRAETGPGPRCGARGTAGCARKGRPAEATCVGPRSTAC